MPPIGRQKRHKGRLAIPNPCGHGRHLAVRWHRRANHHGGGSSTGPRIAKCSKPNDIAKINGQMNHRLGLKPTDPIPTGSMASWDPQSHMKHNKNKDNG